MVEGPRVVRRAVVADQLREPRVLAVFQEGLVEVEATTYQARIGAADARGPGLFPGVARLFQQDVQEVVEESGILAPSTGTGVYQSQC